MNDKSMVVKDNDFILKSRYNLNIQEVKIISLLLSEIKKDDMDFRTHQFDYKYFVGKIGYEKKSIDYLKNVLRKLKQRTFEIDYVDSTGEKVWELFGFISWAVIRSDRVVELKFDEKMGEYLLNLKNNFTIFELEQILQFESFYTFRMYELLKVKYERFKKYGRTENLLLQIDVEELKKLLGVEKKYDRYYNFKQKVLEVSRKELEEKSNIHLEYFEIKKGKSVVTLNIYAVGSEEEEDKRDYYKFVNGLREKCINKVIITDTKRDLIYSISEQGKLYFMNDRREIDKEGAIKFFEWLYNNKKYMTDECKKLMNIKDDTKIELPEFK